MAKREQLRNRWWKMKSKQAMKSKANEQEVNISLIPKPRMKSAVCNYFVSVQKWQ